MSGISFSSETSSGSSSQGSVFYFKIRLKKASAIVKSLCLPFTSLPRLLSAGKCSAAPAVRLP